MDLFYLFHSCFFHMSTNFHRSVSTVLTLFHPLFLNPFMTNHGGGAILGWDFTVVITVIR